MAAGPPLASVTHGRIFLSTPRSELFPDCWMMASFFIAFVCGLYGVVAGAVLLTLVLTGDDHH